MAGANFEEWKTLATNLGLTPDLLKFLNSKVVNQKVLQSTNVLDNVDGSVTIALHFNSVSNSSKISQHKGNFNFGTKTQKRHKTPSQKRRDRARFRTWLEKKKEKRVQRALNTGIIITPPREQSPQHESPLPSPGPSEPVNSADSPPPRDPSPPPAADVSRYCYCKYFHADKEPFSEVKQVCGFERCDLTTEQVKLRACTRCLMVAYCSRDHQKQDWNLQHKDECDPYNGEAVMEEVRSWRQWKDGLHQCLSQSS